MLCFMDQNASWTNQADRVLPGPVWWCVVVLGGAYDLEGLAEHLHRRGLYKNLLDSVMTLDGRVSNTSPCKDPLTEQYFASCHPNGSVNGVVVCTYRCWQ